MPERLAIQFLEAYAFELLGHVRFPVGHDLGKSDLIRIVLHVESVSCQEIDVVAGWTIVVHKLCPSFHMPDCVDTMCIGIAVVPAVTTRYLLICHIIFALCLAAHVTYIHIRNRRGVQQVNCRHHPPALVRVAGETAGEYVPQGNLYLRPIYAFGLVRPQSATAPGPEALLARGLRESCSGQDRAHAAESSPKVGGRSSRHYAQIVFFSGHGVKVHLEV
mmetsp:Transcript_4339/g.7409  ORF Transcript_4339/g.7409 Transcript_4339/m.7409 type:complete len:219 (-) Transcript_4339:387-1043(-)